MNELYDEPSMNGILGQRWHNGAERIDDVVDVVGVNGKVVKLNLSCTSGLVLCSLSKG